MRSRSRRSPGVHALPLIFALAAGALAGCGDRSGSGAPLAASAQGAAASGAAPAGTAAASQSAASTAGTASAAGATAPAGTGTAAASADAAGVVHLAFVGDVAFNYSIGKDLEALRAGTAPKDIEPDFPFAGVAQRLRAADIAVANLECVVSTKGMLATWHKPFRAPLAGIDALLAAGVDVVSVANNHSWDFGPDGFYDMLQHLDEKKLPAMGRGYRQKIAHEPERATVVDVRGTRVAFLGFYLATDADLARDVAAARAQADVVAVYFHWGKEKQSEATPEQKRQAHVAIDAGADLVVGSHVHVLQPTEVYKGKLVAYGLGNFVFMGMNTEERFRRGAILEVGLARDRLASFDLVPTRIDDHGAPRIVVPESSYLPSDEGK